MDKIFVQIGLDIDCEFSYLGIPDKDKRYQHALRWAMHGLANQEWNLPYHEFLSEPMHVVGVDMNPQCIEKLSERYKDYPNLELLNYAIWDKNLDALEHNGFNFITGIDVHNSGITYKTPCITLKKLFALILEKHQGKTIWGLALDVEYAEQSIVDTYDFSIKPQYIKIEIHCVSARIIKRLIEQGYEVFEHRANFTKFVYRPDIFESNAYPLSYESE